jgi:hypothetical protein
MIDIRVKFGLLCLKRQNSVILASVMLPLGELDVLAVPANVIKSVIIRSISEHFDPWRWTWLRRTTEMIRFYLLSMKQILC